MWGIRMVQRVKQTVSICLTPEVHLAVWNDAEKFGVSMSVYIERVLRRSARIKSLLKGMGVQEDMFRRVDHVDTGGRKRGPGRLRAKKP